MVLKQMRPPLWVAEGAFKKRTYQSRTWNVRNSVLTNCKNRIARRDAGRRKYEDRQSEKLTAVRERTDAIRQKDQQTMAMFIQMAKEKFG